MLRNIFTATFLLAAIFTYAQERSFIEQNYIEVSGRAERELSPDEIFLEITITEKDKKGRSSIEKQEKDLFKRLTSIGIDITKDIQITDINTSLEKYLLRKNAILMSKSYIVKVNGTTQLIRLFGQMEEAGITEVNITRTSLSNFDEVSREVMSEAAKNAYLNAVAVVAPLNREVGKALYIQSYANFPRVYRVNTNLRMDLAAPEVESAGFQPDFQKIRLEHQVVVRFALD